MFRPCFVIQYFTLIVFLVSCDYWWPASHVCTDQFIEIVTGSPSQYKQYQLYQYLWYYSLERKGLTATSIRALLAKLGSFILE